MSAGKPAHKFPIPVYRDYVIFEMLKTALENARMPGIQKPAIVQFMAGFNFGDACIDNGYGTYTKLKVVDVQKYLWDNQEKAYLKTLNLAAGSYADMSSTSDIHPDVAGIVGAAVRSSEYEKLRANLLRCQQRKDEMDLAGSTMDFQRQLAIAALASSRQKLNSFLLNFLWTQDPTSFYAVNAMALGYRAPQNKITLEEAAQIRQVLLFAEKVTAILKKPEPEPEPSSPASAISGAGDFSAPASPSTPMRPEAKTAEPDVDVDYDSAKSIAAIQAEIVAVRDVLKAYLGTRKWNIKASDVSNRRREAVREAYGEDTVTDNIWDSGRFSALSIYLASNHCGVEEINNARCLMRLWLLDLQKKLYEASNEPCRSADIKIGRLDQPLKQLLWDLPMTHFEDGVLVRGSGATNWERAVAVWRLLETLPGMSGDGETASSYNNDLSKFIGQLEIFVRHTRGEHHYFEGEYRYTSGKGHTLEFLETIVRQILQNEKTNKSVYKRQKAWLPRLLNYVPKESRESFLKDCRKAKIPTVVSGRSSRLNTRAPSGERPGSSRPGSGSVLGPSPDVAFAPPVPPPVTTTPVTGAALVLPSRRPLASVEAASAARGGDDVVHTPTPRRRVSTVVADLSAENSGPASVAAGIPAPVRPAVAAT